MLINEKILVTGGSGLIGTLLKQELPEAIYISSKDFDLTNENDVINMFNKYKPNIVIHLAAIVGGILDNINHPVSHLENNILMNTLVLKYAYKYKVNRFLTILSCAMYSEKIHNKPFTEQDIYNDKPHSSVFAYSMAKRIMCAQIDSYNEEFGTKYNYLIPCNLYGPSDKNDKIIPIIINKVLDAKKNNKTKIQLFGDGTPIRQFMHSKDIAKIIKEVIQKNITQSFNVAPDTSVTIDEIAKLILKLTNNNNINIEYDITKPNGQIKRDIDNSLFKKIMPNYNFIALEKGIAECIKEIQSKNI